MSPASVRRSVRLGCLGLLGDLVVNAKAAPNGLQSLGASVQLILWRLSECLLEEQAPSAVANSPEALVGLVSASLAPQLIGMAELVILRAPAALQPYLAVCQPLPTGEHCCCCYMQTLILPHSQVSMVTSNAVTSVMMWHAVPGLERAVQELAKRRKDRSLAADLVSFATWCV